MYTPGRGPKARSAAHVRGTTACTLRWASGIARRGTGLALLAGYSTGTPGPSTACTEEAHPSDSTAAAVWSQQRTQAVRVCACAAPTPVPTGTAAPTNVGDTNPPTRAPTFAPTRGPNFADPTGTTDAHAVIAPSPCPLLVALPRSLPPTATAHSIAYRWALPPGRVTALHAPEAPWHYVWLAAATAVPRGR